MSGPEVITLGCRLNAAESEAMRVLAAGEEDLVIVNSCAVTNEAVRQTRQAIRKVKRARPDARVFVTGCAAQVEPDTFAAMPEVARVLAESDATDADDIADFLDMCQMATLAAPAYSIPGGTTQILHGIIARGLGLR